MSKIKAKPNVRKTVKRSPSTNGLRTPLSESTKPREPLWKGPYKDGITNSLLCKFIVCRERFRLATIEGLREIDAFDHAIQYGQFWHEIKEAHRTGRDWKKALTQYKINLLGEYPASTQEIEKWAYICAGQFMVWLKQPSPPQRIRSVQICTEDSFRVPYKLPSGRVIYLRGKYDSISLTGNSLYIEDDKSKGKVDVNGITDTLFGNLQMGLYHVAARQSLVKIDDGYHITGLDKRGSVALPKSATRPSFTGIKYHIVRRPLADQYCIRQKVKETNKQFYDRVIQTVAADPNYFFLTINASMTAKQTRIFQQKMLDPWLEALCDWWEYMESVSFDPWADDTPASPHHMQTPWNVYNSIFGGFRGDYFDLLTRGHQGSLVRVETLFPELTSEDNANPTSAEEIRQTLPRPQKRKR